MFLKLHHGFRTKLNTQLIHAEITYSQLANEDRCLLVTWLPPALTRVKLDSMMW